MASDISRESFQQSRHYSAVRAQQGRVQLDADTNEQVSIEHHRIETETIDVIGVCGVPEDNDGFLIGLLPDGSDLTIAPGRIYVDGLLGELDATAVPITFPTGTSNVVQLDSLIVDNRQMSVGDWVAVAAAVSKPGKILQVTQTGPDAPTLTLNGDVSGFHGQPSPVLQRIITYTTQADLPNPEFATAITSPVTSPPQPLLSLPDGLYIVYVDVWKREITALDDPHLREVALGGPDTSTRLKNIAQVKLLPVATPSPGTGLCAADFPEWDQLVAPPTGTLNAGAKPASTSPNLCQLPPTAGFQRVENQTYRVQIHQGESNRSSSTIKWSRESASVATRIQNIAGSVITVSDVGKDEVLGFNDDDWVEITDDDSELNGFSRPLLQIDKVTPATREITFKQSIPTLTNPSNLQLRRWDQSGASATTNGVAVTGAFQDLESGVQVLLSEGSYRTGDFWIIPARTSTGELDWPPFQVPNTNPIAQPPLGIAHHYCRLAILTVSAGKLSLGVDSDCRTTFPPLTKVCKCDTGIRVLELQSIDPNLQAHTLLNDSNVEIPLFSGIDATCDTAIAPISITRPTCFLTMELPVASGVAAAYVRTALAATVSAAGNVISWRATTLALQFVNSISIPEGDRGILARFTLKGNFIWSATDPNFFLDGDLFGVRQEGTTNISVRLPSGDHRKGGDLEMWFWLVPPPIPTPLIFTFNAAAPAIIRSDGLTEPIGDLTLTGNGGEPTPAGQPVPQVNITIFVNTNNTSRLLGSQTNPQQDAVLLIDDPTVLNVDPTTPNGNGIGLDFKGGGAPNTFIGQQTGMNSVTFFGVPLDPPGNNANRIFRIKNLRVNANLLGVSSTSIPTQIVAFVSMSGSISAQINNPQQTVAFILPGAQFQVTPSTFTVNTSVGVNTALVNNPNDTTSTISFRLRFTEGFAPSVSNCFKIKTDNQSSVVPPANVPQTDEEGFDNLGTGSLNVLPPGSQLPSIGLASNATQFSATFTNVPIGVQIYVTVRDAPANLPLTNPNSPPPIARLLNFTTGGALSEGIPITPITFTGAVTTVVWECVGRDPKFTEGTEAIDFGVVVAMLPNPGVGPPGPVSVALDLNPVSTLGVADASAPIPRFAASGQPPLQAITFFQSTQFPPTGNAGPNQTVAHNTTVQLSGSGQDPQNQTLTHKWTFLTIPAGSTATLSNAGIANPTFIADKPGTHVVQLIVNNGHLDSKPSTVTITATNTPPIANAGTSQNVNVGATVNLDSSHSMDAEHDPLAFAWTFASVPAGSTAQLTGANTASPTFVADVAGTYVAQLVVSDPYSSSSAVTVTITAASSITITLSPNPLNLSIGEAAPISVGISSPAGPNGQLVNLSSSNPAIATVPSNLTIPPGSRSANANVTAVAGGSIVITASASGLGPATASVNILPALTITTLRLPNGTAGTPYSATVAATGGTPPYTWTATGLPAGLLLDHASGLISGTPTALGTSPVSVTVTDSSSGTPLTDSKTLPISLNPGSVVAVVVPSALTTIANQVDLDASASHSPNGPIVSYNYAVAPGGLVPAILQTGPSSPKATIQFVRGFGVYFLTVTVKDEAGQTAAHPIQLTHISAG
jgi:hypothetical protein